MDTGLLPLWYRAIVSNYLAHELSWVNWNMKVLEHRHWGVKGSIKTGGYRNFGISMWYWGKRLFENVTGELRDCGSVEYMTCNARDTATRGCRTEGKNGQRNVTGKHRNLGEFRVIEIDLVLTSPKPVASIITTILSITIHRYTAVLPTSILTWTLSKTNGQNRNCCTGRWASPAHASCSRHASRNISILHGE